MPKYEARKCDKPNDGKWCIHIDGVCDYSLGIFNSWEEAEIEIKKLILRAKVLADAPYAKFTIADPAKNQEFIGPVVAVIEFSEGFDHGVAQSLGCNHYALHMEEEFLGDKLRNGSFVIKYRDGSIEIEPSKSKERDGPER